MMNNVVEHLKVIGFAHFQYNFFSSRRNVSSHVYVFPRKKLASRQERFTRETLVPTLFCPTLVITDGVKSHGFIIFIFYFFCQRTQYCGRTPARPNTWWVERWGSARQPTQYPTTSVILVIHQHPWWPTGACMTCLLPFLFSFLNEAADWLWHGGQSQVQ